MDEQNHDGGCQRELGLAAQHLWPAAWALRSLRMSQTRGSPRSCISRLDARICDTHGWGSQYEGIQQASGTSLTCVLMCAQVYFLTQTYNTHMNFCTECTSVHRHMPPETHVYVYTGRRPHTYPYTDPPIHTCTCAKACITSYACAPADGGMRADKNAHLYIAYK